MFHLTRSGLPAGVLLLAMSALIWAIGRPLQRQRPAPGDGRRLLLVTITVTLVSCAALALTRRVGLPAGITTNGHRLRSRQGRGDGAAGLGL